MTSPPDKEDSEWLSVCCGAKPLGDMGPPQTIPEDPDHETWTTFRIGLCSKCKDHTTFEKDEE